MKTMRSSVHAGFTLVEVVAALFVAGLFVATFAQMYIIQTTIQGSKDNYDKADSLAYSNLRTYAYGEPPSWFVCSYNGGIPNGMTVYSSTDPVDGLESPVTQLVTAEAPYGCGGDTTSIGYPIKITSTVTYGEDGDSVSHATYSTY